MLYVSPLKNRAQTSATLHHEAPAPEGDGRQSDTYQTSRSGRGRLSMLPALGAILACAKTVVAQTPQQVISTIAGQTPYDGSTPSWWSSGNTGGSVNNYPAPTINYTPPSAGPGTGVAIGIALGMVGCIALLGVVTCCCMRRGAARRGDIEMGRVPAPAMPVPAPTMPVPALV